MKEAVLLATENFCSTILCEVPQKTTTSGDYFYGSAISILENGVEHTWYLFFEKEVLGEIAYNLLLEESIDEDLLDDLLKEIANQIIGSAKVLLEEKYPGNTYQLNVPEFMGNLCAPFPIELKDEHRYLIKNRSFIIAR